MLNTKNKLKTHTELDSIKNKLKFYYLNNYRLLFK